MYKRRNRGSHTRCPVGYKRCVSALKQKRSKLRYYTGSSIDKMGTVTEKTIEYLATCEYISTVKEVLRRADSKVLKSICNAAVNAADGDVGISKKLLRYFEKHRSAFSVLMSTKISIGQKIKYVMSDRGCVLELIPPLLTCVLSSIGASFITPEDGETSCDNSDNCESFSNFDPYKKYIGRRVRRERCELEEREEEQTPAKKQKKAETKGGKK